MDSAIKIFSTKPVNRPSAFSVIRNFDRGHSAFKRVDSSYQIKLLPFYIPLLLFVVINLAKSDTDLLSPSSSSLIQNNDDGNPTPNQEVDMCEACRLVVKSFEKGIEETARGKHEGGDTSWEERNLRNYADSEVRLVEIQEKLCEEVKKGKAQCLSLAEDTESEVEEWWFKQRNRNVRLYDYLCINKLKRCCAMGRYGPNCVACLTECNKHGTCDGSGTRQGTGKCNCDIGYTGEECDQCSSDHFRIATSDHFTCLKCDSACQSCYGPGQNNCTECRQGYYNHEVNGCIDINECDVGMDGDKQLCKGNKYCINTDGSYRCADCHVSCLGCVGYGPSMCVSCATGYKMDNDEYICRSKEEFEEGEEDEWDRITSVNKMVRYLVYSGVLIISVILFGTRPTLYVLYTFLFGLVVFLLLSEFDILDELQDFPKTRSE